MTPQQALNFETGNGPAISGCGLGGAPSNETTDPIIAGCMDSTAINYNPQATADDGSCEFAPGPQCDPLRIGFSWVQYGLGVGANSISQFDALDPIVSYLWTWGNGDSIQEDSGSQGYFYDVTGTFTVGLQITTQSGEVRSISTAVPIVSPYDNTTAPFHLIYSTTPTAGLSFCELPPS